MIFYGVRASKIGTFDIPRTKCQHCDEKSNQEISVFGRYFHIFWIPIFPVGRKAVAECTQCKKTIKRKEFTPELKQQYLENKSKAKRPIWHWFGLGLIGLLISLITLIGVTAEHDPRSDLLAADLKEMTDSPTMETDSISFKIKKTFDSFATDEINPSEFKYATKVEGNKALILVSIPKLRKVEKEARGEAMEMIEMIVNNQEDLKNKEKYIGVEGLISMMLIKTPTYEKNSKLASTSELYEFYGPKQEVEQ